MTGPAATAAVAIKSGKWGENATEGARNCPNASAFVSRPSWGPGGTDGGGAGANVSRSATTDADGCTGWVIVRRDHVTSSARVSKRIIIHIVTYHSCMEHGIKCECRRH